ncbi:hypothetical protein EVAR_59357_1 [Eumeta japonica]|uniref:Uncharacterized protein n=1 Tax=Eumeta variegata TaxID=151549 RepID=A0A4C2A3J9_EUMVA|nr:hypothetical protein EVAR_59357_1 [Eumeta japonica]
MYSEVTKEKIRSAGLRSDGKITLRFKADVRDSPLTYCAEAREVLPRPLNHAANSTVESHLTCLIGAPRQTPPAPATLTS